MKSILIAAQSIDGFITRHNKPGSGFTSPGDKTYFNKTVREFDCLIFGRQNYQLSINWIQNRLPADQLKIVLTRNPEQCRQNPAPQNVEFTSASIPVLKQSLKNRGIKRTAILGGGQIYGLFLREKAIDEIWLTIEPLIFGSGIKLTDTETDLRAELLSIEKLDLSTILLKYKPIE